MVERKQINIPTLSKDISLWKRYVDDTICFVNSNCISHVLESLNSFHSNIKFTIEIEKESKIAFLDILLIRYKNLINTTMYHKKTDTEKYLKQELNHIEIAFKHQNSCPSWIIDKVFKQVQQAQQVPPNTANEKEKDKKKIHRLLLPYQGEK